MGALKGAEDKISREKEKEREKGRGGRGEGRRKGKRDNSFNHFCSALTDFASRESASQRAQTIAPGDCINEK